MSKLFFWWEALLRVLTSKTEVIQSPNEYKTMYFRRNILMLMCVSGNMNFASLILWTTLAEDDEILWENVLSFEHSS